MTDASTIVATIENRPARGVPDVSGNTRRPVDKAKEAAKADGKTFADSLKNAQSRQTEVSERTSRPEKAHKETKSALNPEAVKTARLTVRTDSSEVTETAIPRAGKADKNPARPVSSDKADNRGSETPEPVLQSAAHEAADPADPAVPIQAGHGAFSRNETRAASADRSERADSDRETAGVAVKRVRADAVDTTAMKSGDLASRSGRVEVIDNRQIAKADGKTVSPPGARGKDAAVRNGGDAPAKSEGAPSTVSRSDGFAVAESDIEIDTPSGRETAPRSAAAELARKLDGEAGGDIVRQVKVILNRSNAGEVRINLRPDNLGRVRVRIQLEDNRLTGRIFVESAAAREAFRDAIDGLQAKLVEAGFGAADLELAWDESAQNFADGGRRRGGRTADSGQSAREFENTVPVTIVDETADGRVNLVV